MSATFCRACVHHREVGRTGREIWYNNLCVAEPEGESAKNFVTGEWERPRPVYCRDRNKKGECRLFHPIVERKK